MDVSEEEMEGEGWSVEKWRKVVEPREVPSANCDLCRNEKKC